MQIGADHNWKWCNPPIVKCRKNMVKFTLVVSYGLGKLSREPINIEVDPSYPPKKTPARPVPKH